MMSIRNRRRHEPTAIESTLTDELEVLAAVLAKSPEGTSLVFGAPCRCPLCGDFGLVDSVMAVRGVAEHRCARCMVAWVITERALLARAEADDAGAPVGAGLLVEGLEEQAVLGEGPRWVLTAPRVGYA
jgi:hypothetical protein